MKEMKQHEKLCLSSRLVIEGVSEGVRLVNKKVTGKDFEPLRESVWAEKDSVLEPTNIITRGISD